MYFSQFFDGPRWVRHKRRNKITRCKFQNKTCVHLAKSLTVRFTHLILVHLCVKALGFYLLTLKREYFLHVIPNWYCCSPCTFYDFVEYSFNLIQNFKLSICRLVWSLNVLLHWRYKYNKNKQTKKTALTILFWCCTRKCDHTLAGLCSFKHAASAATAGCQWWSLGSFLCSRYCHRELYQLSIKLVVCQHLVAFGQGR